MTEAVASAEAVRPEVLIVGALGSLKTRKDPSFFRLKRGADLLDAMLEPIFPQLKRELRDKGFFVSDDLLACSLLMLARLNEEPGSVPVARALSRAEYSDSRFGNLIRSEDADELFTQLQRAVRFCKDKVCPFDLTRTILSWTENRLPFIRKRLIAEFHSFASEEAEA